MQCRSLLLLLAPTLLTAAGAEDRAGPEEIARRLVAHSFAELHRGDSLVEGWEKAYDRGLDLASRAGELDPGNADAWYARFCNLGRKAERSSLASQMLHLRELRWLLSRTLELDPSHAHAWEARGEMLLRMPWFLGGSQSEGEDALHRAAELAPDWAKPPLRLAEIEEERGEGATAVELARQARDLAEAAGDGGLRAEAEAMIQRLQASR